MTWGGGCHRHSGLSRAAETLRRERAKDHAAARGMGVPGCAWNLESSTSQLNNLVCVLWTISITNNNCYMENKSGESPSVKWWGRGAGQRTQACLSELSTSHVVVCWDSLQVRNPARVHLTQAWFCLPEHLLGREHGEQAVRENTVLSDREQHSLLKNST